MVRELLVRSIVLEPVNGPTDGSSPEPLRAGVDHDADVQGTKGGGADPTTRRRNKRFPNFHADDVAASEQQLRFLTYPTVLLKPVQSAVFLSWVARGDLRLCGRSRLVQREVVYLVTLLFWLPLFLARFIAGILDFSACLGSIFMLGVPAHSAFFGQATPGIGGAASLPRGEGDLLDLASFISASLPSFVHCAWQSTAIVLTYWVSAVGQVSGVDLDQRSRLEPLDFSSGYIVRVLCMSVNVSVMYTLYLSLGAYQMWTGLRLVASMVLGFAGSTAFGLMFMNIVNYAKLAGEDWEAGASWAQRCKTLALSFCAVVGGWLSFAQITDWMTGVEWWFCGDMLVIFAGYSLLFFFAGYTLSHLSRCRLVSEAEAQACAAGQHRGSGDTAADATAVDEHACPCCAAWYDGGGDDGALFDMDGQHMQAPAHSHGRDGWRDGGRVGKSKRKGSSKKRRSGRRGIQAPHGPAHAHSVADSGYPSVALHGEYDQAEVGNGDAQLLQGPGGEWRVDPNDVPPHVAPFADDLAFHFHAVGDGGRSPMRCTGLALLSVLVIAAAAAWKGHYGCCATSWDGLPSPLVRPVLPGLVSAFAGDPAGAGLE